VSEPCIGVSAYFEFIVRAFMFHLLVKPIFEGLMRGQTVCSAFESLILLSGLTGVNRNERVADGVSARLPSACSYAIDPVMMGSFFDHFLGPTEG